MDASVVGRKRNGVSVEKTDKCDNGTLSVYRSDEELRTIEASHCQVLRRTRADGLLRMEQQTRGQKGSEAWHAIVTRYDERNIQFSICSTD